MSKTAIIEIKPERADQIYMIEILAASDCSPDDETLHAFGCTDQEQKYDAGRKSKDHAHAGLRSLDE